MTALAAITDLSARTTAVITNPVRALALLDDASAAVRVYTGQQFTRETTVARLMPRHGVIILPQRPVVAVVSVADINANTVTYSWDGLERVHVGANVPDSWSFEPWTYGYQAFDVNYTHGYLEIPDDIIAVVCQVAGRAYGRDLTESGVTQEAIAGYSYSIGSAAAAGGVGFLSDERAVLDRYRRTASMSVVGP